MMTPDEIRNLIETSITGQGTNVDAGGVLSEILKSLLDLATGKPAGQKIKVGEEELIGEWVEGENSYDYFRKVIQFGPLPNQGSKNYAHGITNMHRVVSASAMASKESQYLPVPLATVGSANIYMGIGPKNITIQTSSDRSAFDQCWVTIYFIRAKQ